MIVPQAAESAAAKVLSSHRKQAEQRQRQAAVDVATGKQSALLPCRVEISQDGKTEAMQRLAIQKG